jgi:hypothetical protein
MSDFVALTFLEQSLLIDRILLRAKMHDDKPADALLVLSAEDARHLDHLSMRLARLAPFQEQIEKLVMKR